MMGQVRKQVGNVDSEVLRIIENNMSKYYQALCNSEGIVDPQKVNFHMSYKSLMTQDWAKQY